MRSCIFNIISPVFSVTWSSEIILIYWFTAQETFLIISNVESIDFLNLLHPQIQIVLSRPNIVLHNKPYINGKCIYSDFRICINLNFEKCTLSLVLWCRVTNDWRSEMMMMMVMVMMVMMMVMVMVSKEQTVCVSAVIMLSPWSTRWSMRAEDVTFLCFGHIYLWDGGEHLTGTETERPDIFQTGFLLLLIQSVTVWE